MKVQFFQQQLLDFNTTWGKYYKKYKEKLGVSLKQLCRRTTKLGTYSSPHQEEKIRRVTI